DGAPRLVERRIPGQDHAHYAEGLASRVGVIAGAEIDRLAVDRVHQPAVELEVLRRDLDLEGSLQGGLPGLEALELGELGALLADSPGDGEEHAPALDRPPVAPFRKCRARGGDCRVDVGAIAARHLGDLLTGYGAQVVEVAAAPRCNL